MGPLQWKLKSLIHWTTREVPTFLILREITGNGLPGPEGRTLGIRGRVKTGAERAVLVYLGRHVPAEAKSPVGELKSLRYQLQGWLGLGCWWVGGA